MIEAVLDYLPDAIEDYKPLLDELEKLSQEERFQIMRDMCRHDLYFLLRYACKRKDMENAWLLARCREVQANPNGYLDLWARGHYKSSIITFGKTIQDVLSSHGECPLAEWNGREVTVGIFSHTRPIAKAFLRQIMNEFKNNQTLKGLFPDILWSDPEKEAPKWSEDDGLIVKRESNPKESTIEAAGLIEGQPISKHYIVRVYDDVVTPAAVSTPDAINKATGAWENSLNLGTSGGYARYIGTRYHFNDTYKEIIKREAVIPRIYPATEDGKAEGDPVLLTREEIATKRKEQGIYTFGCQMLLNPTVDSIQGFDKEWLRHYKDSKDGLGMNIYIIVDPANSKNKKADYTAIIVIGAAQDKNLYVLDIVRDRFNLIERTKKLFDLHKFWMKGQTKITTGYEKYGKDADIEHIESKMDDDNYHFDIISLGGSMHKNDRIRRLVPSFEAGKIWLPRALNYVDCEGKSRDLVKEFIDDEYTPFPVGNHDDMLDALARIKDTDMNVEYPIQSQHSNITYIPTTGW